MLLLTYFAIAILVSFMCSILEAVILSITPAYIEVLKDKKPKTSKLLKAQKKDIDKSIGAILTLNTFAHTLGAAGVGAEAAKIFGHEYMFYISAVLTILILVFSEIIPKTIGAYYWKALSPLCSRVIQVLVFITYPLLIFMNKITKIISSKKDKSARITKEEFEASISISGEEGILRQQQSDIIENLMNLNTTKVADIFTPRKVTFAIKLEELKRSFQKDIEPDFDLEQLKVYSRVPIYNENIDDIVGVMLSKEFFYAYIKNDADIESLVKPVFTINENIPVSKLIDLFISKNAQMFIVVDKYEQTEGIVTLEDAIETLLGTEIVDELDQITDLRVLAKQISKSE